MSYSINPYTPDTHNIPTMPSDTCTPQMRQKRKVTQPAFTRVQSHNFLHSCAITYMRQTHDAHDILTLTTVTFKTLQTQYVIYICHLRLGIYHKVNNNRELSSKSFKTENLPQDH